NAGVEAARAGEAGRGFAVVASEVRALAQRSSDAAREINELISASGTQVKRGVQLVDQAGEALAGIVESVSEISHNVGEIAVSAREQSSGLAEINEAVNQLDQVTQQNAAMFEETTAASHSLTREAETLTSTMGRFKTGAARVSEGEVISPRFAARGAGNADVSAQTHSAAKPMTQVTAVQKIEDLPQDDLDDWDDF
ncbi:methyl-accepting chemotaxis protein, partial [Aliiroseovarius lamellibrachiae]|uniref:methyl-accepting chemotaxis protein n=1 Tax=Aliiroseovarius lamellibrachiae TaxID=1924933 RepID=UPI001FE5BD75